MNVNSDTWLLLLTLVGLFATLSFPSLGIIAYAKLICGIFFYVFMIGYLLLDTIFESYSKHALLLAVPMGLAIQNMFVVFLYNVVAPYFIQKVNFGLCIVVFNTAFLISVFTIRRREKRQVNVNRAHLFSSAKQLIGEPIVLIFVVGLIVRIVYQTLNTTTIMPDGAMYADAAKQLVNQGQFTSSVLNDGSTNSYQLQYGLVPYPFTWFSISLFFLLSAPTFAFAKLFTVLMGAVLVLLTYAISIRFFDRPIALAASAIVALNPLLIFYSAVLYGPEITSLFYYIFSLYFLIGAVRNHDFRHSVIAGLLASVAVFSWQWGMLLVYLTSFAILFALERKFKAVFLCVLFELLSFVILGFSVFLYPLLLSFAAGATYCIIRRFWTSEKRGIMVCLLIFFAMIGLVAQLALDRSYMLPQLVIEISQQSGAANARVTSLLFPNANSFLSLLLLYLSNLAEYSTVALLICAALAFIFRSHLKETLFFGSFIIVFGVVGTLILPSSVLINRSYPTSRFFIAPSWFMSVLAAVFITNAARTLARRSKESKTPAKSRNFTRTNDFKPSRREILAFAFIFLTVSFTYYYGYSVSVQDGINNATFMNYASSNEAMKWLSSNTDPNSIILSIDPRTTAWFSGRMSAGLLIREGASWSTDLQASDLIFLSREFDARYVFLPYYTLGNTNSRLLRELYTDCPEILYLSAFDKSTLIGASSQFISAEALKRVFISGSEPLSVIYEISTVGLSSKILWLDDTFQGGWATERGTASISNNTIRLFTNENETWGMYIAHTFVEPVSITKSPNLALEIKEESENATAGVYFSFTDGSQYSQYFSKPGFYLVDLSAFAGKCVSYIYLYNLVIFTKSVGSYSVSYEFVAFVDLNTAE